MPVLSPLADALAVADRDRCRQLLELVDAALSVLDPETAVRHALARAEPLGDGVVVAALGKAAPAMARGAAAALGDRVRSCLVISDHEEEVPDGATLMVASHPLPDASSLEAGRRLLAEVSRPADHVVVLVSGGGSALAELPGAGMALPELVEVYALLLKEGVPIEESNIIRSHVSAIKGGKLAAAASAPVTTVVLSDVGPRLDLVASGPTIPATSTPADAVEVLRRRHLLERVPPSVRVALERGEPVEPRTGRVLSAGDGATAARAAAEAGAAKGIPTRVTTTSLQGEAAGAALRALDGVADGEVGVLAGETTVTVRGAGRGGRNQEAALAGAVALAGRSGAFLTFGTDGVDGPTDAAGAYVDGSTAGRIRRAGIDPHAALHDNDSHTALAASASLLRTGPTGVNVADLWLVDRR